MPLKNAVALRAFDHAGDAFAVGPVHRIEAGHFADWQAAGLVREATAAEVAGEKTKAKRRQGTRRRSAAETAPVTAGSKTPPTDPDPDPAAPAA